MMPVRCGACGRRPLPRDPRTVVTRSVAHVRDDHPDTIGLPCQDVLRVVITYRDVFDQAQQQRLDEADLDA